MKINLASQLHLPSLNRNLPDHIADRFGSRGRRYLPLIDDVMVYLTKLSMAKHLNFDDWRVEDYYGNSGWRL